MRERLGRAKGGGRKSYVKERALSYSVLRRAWIDSLVFQLRQQRTIPLKTPVDHKAVFIEPDRHRDKDNVYGGGMKLLWDVLRAAKLIPQDTAAHIGTCRGWDVVYAHPSRTGVWLSLWEPGDPAAVVLAFQGRLPDLNEWGEARELGARRSVRA